MHELVPSRRCIPHPDPLVVPTRHDLTPGRRECDARHGARMRARVPVEYGFPARVFGGVGGWQHADGVIGVEGGVGGVGAADVVEKDKTGSG